MASISDTAFPNVIKISSIVSRNFNASAVFIFAFKTSVFPAAASSKSIPVPYEANDKPLVLSTSAAAVNPSISDKGC